MKDSACSIGVNARVIDWNYRHRLESKTGPRTPERRMGAMNCDKGTVIGQNGTIKKRKCGL